MLRDRDQAILNRVIRSEELGHWAGDVERGREVIAAIDANFTGGEPREEAIADFVGCLLGLIDRRQPPPIPDPLVSAVAVAACLPSTS